MIVTRIQTEKFATEVRSNLLRISRKCPKGSVLSDELKKHIRKRVPPSTLESYTNILGAIGLLSLEMESIGTRINRYKYIGKYHHYFSSPESEIGIAFITHLHDLRPSELYIILERGSETMRFASIVAKELGLAGEDQSRTFEKQFKKRLERRLRERHRIVHAHERPSLTSRLLEMPEPKNEEDRDALSKVLGKIALDVITLLAQMTEKDLHATFKKVVGGQLRRVHERAFEEEAKFMWRLFVDLMRKTIKGKNAAIQSKKRAKKPRQKNGNVATGPTVP